MGRNKRLWLCVSVSRCGLVVRQVDLGSNPLRLFSLQKLGSVDTVL